MIFLHTKWHDITVIDRGGTSYLLQGRINKLTNAKSFRLIGFYSLFNCAEPEGITVDTLKEANFWRDE